jgi:hypothetical protein
MSKSIRHVVDFSEAHETDLHTIGEFYRYLKTCWLLIFTFLIKYKMDTFFILLNINCYVKFVFFLMEIYILFLFRLRFFSDFNDV